MHRGYRFKLYPTAEQAETLGQWVGVTRLVYNLALEQRRDFWRQFRANTGRSIGLASQGPELTQLRAEFDWIGAVPQTVLEAALNDLDKAYAAFFRGAGYPAPRRLSVNDAIRFRARDIGVKDLNAKWATIRLPKLGVVRFRKSRDIAGRMLTASVIRKADGWFLSFSADIGEAPALNALPSVGIDRGIAATLSLSTGEHVRLPTLADADRRMRKAQRRLSKRVRGSRRYAKQRRKVARTKSYIARVRSHHLHVASASVARRFGVVALEKLNIAGMTASAAGTIDAPGCMVPQKSGLNRAILAQGWSIFAAQLDYKLEAAGGRLIYVPSAHTSQTCSACGVVDRESRKSQARFACVHCGHEAHADTNAAIEIMRRSTAFVEGHQLRSAETRTLAA